MKIVSIVGTRPQFIKCAPLSKELRKQHQGVMVHTGQHYDYDMSQIFFNELGIPRPDYNLGVGSGSHGYQIAEMIKLIEEVVDKEQPDMVLVYGDTNSTLAGSLVASKLNISLGHVEAGLRSYDKTMPEEKNRIITDHCSDLLFCPTQNAVDSLKKEGINQGVHLTGDVMVDALINIQKVSENSNILQQLNLQSKKYVLTTIHRASNADLESNLINIVEALCQIEETVVFPIHPRTEKQIRKFGLYNRLSSNVCLSEPLGYIDFIKLLKHSSKVLTDSGGVQKEAYILGVPCITLRDRTEWIETVEDGWNKLAGTNPKKIVENIKNFRVPEKRGQEFGNGACGKISYIIDRECNA